MAALVKIIWGTFKRRRSGEWRKENELAEIATATSADAGKPDVKLCAAPMIPRYAWRLDGLPSPSK